MNSSSKKKNKNTEKRDIQEKNLLSRSTERRKHFSRLKRSDEAEGVLTN